MASTVPADGRIFWTGNQASIPASWSRDVDFNGRFLQGDGDSYTVETNGGGDHNHTEIAHDHSLASHTHDVAAGASADASTLATNSGSAHFVPVATHDHDTIPSGSNSSSVTGSSTGTVDNASTSPRRINVYVLEPDDGSQDIPDDGVCITDETTLPTGFAKLSLTTDGTFIVGKVPGDTAASQQLAPSEHSHTTSAHVHTFASHTHVDFRSNSPVGAANNAGGSGQTRRQGDHHIVSLQATTPSDTDSQTGETGVAPIEPAYIDMLGIQNTSGSATTPIGVIIPFVGTPAEAGALSGWDYCDGTGVTPDLRDRFIRLTETNGDVGDTAGSNSHSHNAGTNHHSHNGSASHTHVVVEVDDGTEDVGLFGFSGVTTADHSHSWTVSSETVGTTVQSIATSSDDGRPAFRTVIFIKRVATVSILDYERKHRGVMRGAYRGVI